MITKKEKEAIVEILGSKPVKKLTDFGKKKRYQKEDGKYHNWDTFSKVLNGRDYPVVENIILNCVKYYKKKEAKKNRIKKELLAEK